MSIVNEQSKEMPTPFMPVICRRCDVPMNIRTITPTMTSHRLTRFTAVCLHYRKNADRFEGRPGPSGQLKRFSR
jgi:hypothetical protein